MSDILGYIRGGIFDPAATEAMGRAFDLVCNASRHLIANRIIGLVKAGERDAIVLSEKVISELS